MVLKSKYCTGVSRFNLMAEAASHYIAIYEFANYQDLEAHLDCPELAAAIKEMEDTWGNKAEILSKSCCEFIKEWKK
jgi:hypothetical protein